MILKRGGSKEPQLKVGDKLYELSYYGEDRAWATYTITKINPKSVAIKYCGVKCDWTIPLIDIGSEFFLSKEDCVRNKITEFEYELSRIVEPSEKELKYLRRKLKELRK